MTTPIFVAFATVASLPALATSLFHGIPYAFMPSNNRVSLITLSSKQRTGDSVVPALATSPGKGDLYKDDELFELLTLHQALNPEEEFFSSTVSTNGEGDDDLNDESISGGIHDWVLETLNHGDAESKLAPASNGIVQSGEPPRESPIPDTQRLALKTIKHINSSSCSSKARHSAPMNQLAYDNLQTLLRDKKPNIRAIATDVDGTLLSGKYLHPQNKEAILKAINLSYSSLGLQKIQHFFPATGKSRRGAIISLGPTVGPLLYKCPGVFIQGLYCVDKDGNVIFEKKLPASAVQAAEELVSAFGISIVGYDGDSLYTTEQTNVVASLSEYYGEPTVELIANEGNHSGALELVKHRPGMHKLLLMDEDVAMLTKAVRPKLEELATEHGATVTQALPTMLELLPEGCSKAYGVGKLCEALGIDTARELLALGDAENDVKMLEDAAIGVAVGNACPQARAAADFIMQEMHDEGAAGLAMNLFGFDA